MKWGIFSCLIFCLFGTISSAQSDRLTMLQKQRNSALKRAAEPINRKYILELQKLLKILTASGELEKAIEVKKEIAKAKGDQPADEDIKPELSISFLDDTKWENVESAGNSFWIFSKNQFVLNKVDDRGRSSVSTNGIRKWEIVDVEKRIIQIEWYGGKAMHTFNEEFTILTGNNKVLKVVAEEED